MDPKARAPEIVVEELVTDALGSLYVLGSLFIKGSLVGIGSLTGCATKKYIR